MMAVEKRARGRILVATCASGRRYVVYNASEINNPPDHAPDKWYAMPYPVPLGMSAGKPFDSFADAEQAVARYDAALARIGPEDLDGEVGRI